VADPSEDVFVKNRSDAPTGSFRWEAAGLDWLRAAQPSGGVRIVRVRQVGERRITLDRITAAPATPAAAKSFGRSLAATHAAGAEGFGSGPPGWSGDGFIGRQSLPLQVFSRWGEFYAQTRLLPYARAARRTGTLDNAGLEGVEAVCVRLHAGEYDDDAPPARIHGDLWAGNVLYARSGARAVPNEAVPNEAVPIEAVPIEAVPIEAVPIEAVLIDPAAHGGHRLTDLAMLALFGTEFLDRVLGAYADTAPLPTRWRELIGLHQLHPLLVHAVTHGPSYGRQAQKVAAEYS
jgi:fructosamine-3-kinase